MNGSVKNRFLKLIAKEMTAQYNVSMEFAMDAIKRSAVNALMDDCPEYVDHVPLSHLAQKVYEEVNSVLV